MDTSNKLEVIQKQGNYEIIRLDQGAYCVRKTYKSWFGLGPIKKTFMVLNLVGTSMTYDNVSTAATVGTLDRCQYVFNANVLKEGGV